MVQVCSLVYSCVRPMKPYLSVVSLPVLVLLAVLFWPASSTAAEVTQLPPISVMLGSIGTLLLLRGRNFP